MLTFDQAQHGQVFHFDSSSVPVPGVKCESDSNTFVRYGRTRNYQSGWSIPVRSKTGAYTFLRQAQAHQIHGVLDCPHVRARQTVRV